jgi:hypothetical protein
MKKLIWSVGDRRLVDVSFGLSHLRNLQSFQSAMRLGYLLARLLCEKKSTINGNQTINSYCMYQNLLLCCPLKIHV